MSALKPQGTVNTSHPRPVALAHVVLLTTAGNYKAMVNFYTRVLAADISYRTETMTFLRYDHEHHRIAIIQLPHIESRPENKTLTGLDHVAFTFESLTSLAQTYATLRSDKEPIMPVWTVNHGPTTSMYYRDPDGNKVELQVDNFDTLEESIEFMNGPLFAMNPFGTDFDAEEWATAILSKVGPNGEEGLSQNEIRKLKTRTEIGERLSPSFIG
ncbi:putative biphenyl-2,3-diol 1,2-dioxygenase [Talaromyces proteolyticus]|uniref:Biphenyl-2,3-diol 1,2-dioxygenase n=1 Tax=Talaromyces proteolyticus TaxID=1131652 RepID=A0AAD4PV49_9EURO|nr:putative biphenyl-2,3-diol 1,2-dioxygenase [Talaromyces proteolyticus]KAH8690221.1 putative biphenyl-2,3-diol 1,2-dioxygenase [Talaromyces proteolyticus]